MSGDPSPDCTGYYDWAGTHGGEDYFLRESVPSYWIWWCELASWWMITPYPPQEAPTNGFWDRTVTITGEYSDGGGYTGNPVVAAY